MVTHPFRVSGALPLPRHCRGSAGGLLSRAILWLYTTISTMRPHLTVTSGDGWRTRISAFALLLVSPKAGACRTDPVAAHRQLALMRLGNLALRCRAHRNENAQSRAENPARTLAGSIVAVLRMETA
jgi:hypothetical protein